MATIRIEDGFITGGRQTARITPNFALKEFADSQGRVYVHRELVATLQMIRDGVGDAVEILSLEPLSQHDRKRGLAAAITSSDLEVLLRVAKKLKKSKYFARLEEIDSGIYVEIPDPAALPDISPELAFDCGVRVTAAFETSGDPYQQVTGNFDGAGLSFGPIQCNFKSGTLQELFRRFRGENEAFLIRCFDNNESDYSQFWKVLDGSTRRAIAWGDSLSTGRRKTGFSQPWKGYLQCVGEQPVFRDVMLRYAYDKYGKNLLSTLSFMRGISPVKVKNLRCLAALYDMGVQQGGYSKARNEIIVRVFHEQPTDEFALTKIVIEERAKKANRKYRADCLSRRMGILERKSVRVSLDGRTATRSNPMVYLLRDSAVADLDGYLEESNEKVG